MLGKKRRTQNTTDVEESLLSQQQEEDDYVSSPSSSAKDKPFFETRKLLLLSTILLIMGLVCYTGVSASLKSSLTSYSASSSSSSLSLSSSPSSSSASSSSSSSLSLPYEDDGMNWQSTYVSALFNTNREKQGDGRPWEEYLAWVNITAQHNAPMVFFGIPEIKPYVMENRPEHLKKKTIYIEQEMEDVPYYQYKEKIHAILTSDEYKSKMGGADRVECRLDLYNVIIFSKFDWLKEVAMANPFKTKSVYWLDGGAGR